MNLTNKILLGTASIWVLLCMGCASRQSGSTQSGDHETNNQVKHQTHNGSQETPTELAKRLPVMFKSFSPYTLIKTANELIGMGENKSRRVLEAYLKIELHSGVYDPVRSINVLELCRMLYHPASEKEPLRPAWLGTPNLELDLNEWPDQPLVIVDGIPFKIQGGYIMGGVPENMSDYLTYCHENGKFQNTPYKFPSKEDGHLALKRFFSSDRWKRIDWKKVHDIKSSLFMQLVFQADDFFIDLSSDGPSDMDIAKQRAEIEATVKRHIHEVADKTQFACDSLFCLNGITIYGIDSEDAQKEIVSFMKTEKEKRKWRPIYIQFFGKEEWFDNRNNEQRPHVENILNGFLIQ